MLNVSIIIPTWNEQDRITDCLDNATRQTVMPHEVIVVDNRSTDNTVAIVQQYMQEHPEAPIRLLHQDEEQGLIPTRNYGLNHATGDVLGRVDADCMLKPDWVEVVAGIFTEDAEAMGATGPVTYYDMPARRMALRGDDSVRRHTYRADGGQVLLFGSNMALRASAWKLIAGEVCLDKEDVMHEDIDVSLHLLGRGLKTVYSERMICGISARRMDTSFKSFRNYMKRFKNTFEAHPQHWRNHKSERTLYLMYPWLHALFPVYQQYLKAKDINPAVRIWFREQVNLARREGDNLDDLPGIEEFISEVPTDIDGISEVNEDIPTDAESEAPQPEPVSKMSN
ncbi:glycosyltransferase [Bifidobacterium pseudolongum]|uniref:Glycosyl transferase n=1 Tax=Bifidobacterium pseudolongum subsp. pseudolongum TaxID=31954 RepID=A0A4Q5AA59_9BIFI|nr:glycosyltransferase family A protein [Bifidobacterium pseudolongum]KFI79421.1 glycosyltransferase [Bifidobacterium pseudolongum subsp. pseudolongum]PKV01606.1 glycosyl transferase [Bifidobacterium pseudolongum subsp. pseudolongum]PKV08290.1 glycosyl transferase [Bifidobacterium pseudolongum subsp. pseudolongum]RYQ22035.1 glycosyl transferase [Bifidobacterium pseudolongum subsp. pseudolongum]RYQ49475.1 glycosyl transferase [Bifidobacterium pseudolongum subsp. pseudolongum]